MPSPAVPPALPIEWAHLAELLAQPGSTGPLFDAFDRLGPDRAGEGLACILLHQLAGPMNERVVANAILLAGLAELEAAAPAILAVATSERAPDALADQAVAALTCMLGAAHEAAVAYLERRGAELSALVVKARQGEPLEPTESVRLRRSLRLLEALTEDPEAWRPVRWGLAS
ncbi:MAG: hypothetical protein QM704_26750 [Anaeromyxobacteraceae bacterium]